MTRVHHEAPPPGISSKRLADGSTSWGYRFKHGKKANDADNYVSQAGFATMREAVEEMGREKARSGKAQRVSKGEKSFGDFSGSGWSMLPLSGLPRLER
jgi:hypothetical protein